jgi:hypothetical protein
VNDFVIALPFSYLNDFVHALLLNEGGYQLKQVDMLTPGFSHLEILRVRGQCLDTHWHTNGSFTNSTLVGQGWFPLRSGTEIG